MFLLGQKLELGTRASKLALWQAEFAKSKLEQLGFECELVPIKTQGDKTNRPLYELGGKGLFTKELERALLNKRIDVAVHSLKDMSVYEDERFEFVVFERDFWEDTFVSFKGDVFELEKNAKIGTTSLRRRAELLRLKPDLEFVDLRGNLDTRLKKLKEGLVDGIIVSKSGLMRLGLYDGDFMYDLRFMIPAAGQGVVALEYLSDSPFKDEFRKLEDNQTRICIDAERAFVRELNASCNYPIGARAYFDGDEFCMDVMYGCPKDLRNVIRYSFRDPSVVLVLSSVIDYVERRIHEGFCQ